MAAVLRCLLLSLLMLRIISAQSQPATDPNEVAALNKILSYWNLEAKLNMNVDPCTKNATWAPESANPRIACDCSAKVCHITHLKIYALNIMGELPQELFNLTELVDLNLDQNVLSGSIPPEIRRLTKMQYLGLGINNFSGLVPAELGNLTRLSSLSFGSNNFHGPLPKELGKLTLLTQLYIDSSGVSGPIPQELSNLKSLSTWWASDNRFTGKLPEFIGELTSLIVLAADNYNNGGGRRNSIFVKVKMEGVMIGRKIDLMLFNSYQALTTTLLNMFAKYRKGDKDDGPYILSYLDKDGDWLLAGDVPWQTFINSVHRMEILKRRN